MRTIKLKLDKELSVEIFRLTLLGISIGLGIGVLGFSALMPKNPATSIVLTVYILLTALCVSLFTCVAALLPISVLHMVLLGLTVGLGAASFSVAELLPKNPPTGLMIYTGLLLVAFTTFAVLLIISTLPIWK